MGKNETDNGLSPIVGKAEETVRDRLKIEGFLEDSKATLFAKLEQIYKDLKQHPEADLDFLHQGSSLLGAMIQVASKPQDLRSAIAWATNELSTSDPACTLSTLALRYVVEKGSRESSSSGEKERNKIWSEIRDRIAPLTHVQCKEP